MSESDLPQVLAIEQVSFPLPYSKNLFLMELNLNIAHLVVACEGETILGYMDFWHVDTELTVINVAVHPQSRGLGVGSYLMEYLIKYGTEYKVEQVFLDVRESNTAAIALYKKFGLKPIDVRRGYYQDNEEDALVMELKLS